MNLKKRRCFLLTVFFLAIFTFSAHAASFDINLSFTGLTSSQQTIFSQAESYWESVITGYQTGISISSLDIDAEGKYIDGSGGILGSAGPNSITTQAGFTLSTSGSMQFDTADLANLESSGRLYDVIRHEIAHVIGFGTLWTSNGLSMAGTGQYTGTAGLAAYRNEFDAAAAFVPVELEGGTGTADGHWDEVYQGAALTGITDALGRDMRDELMTGWLNSPVFVSNTTLMSFEDLGYTVVPIPGTIVLLGAGLLGLVGIKRGRGRTA
jgi:hypothetical protein